MGHIWVLINKRKCVENCRNKIKTFPFFLYLNLGIEKEFEDPYEFSWVDKDIV